MKWVIINESEMGVENTLLYHYEKALFVMLI